MTKSVKVLVEQLLEEGAYSGQHMKYMDRFKFGLTFKHMINRLTTASITGTTIENTRKALAKTCADCNSMDDINFLRRDASAGLSTLAKMADRSPDKEYKKQLAVHMQWIRTDYRAMLSKRTAEIKAQG